MATRNWNQQVTLGALDGSQRRRILKEFGYLTIQIYNHMEGSSGHVVECRTVNQGDSGSIPTTAVSKFTQFRSRSFGRDVKSWWVLLSGVYAGEVKDPTQGVNV